jgi:phage terminase large subunit GpA-like protein
MITFIDEMFEAAVDTHYRPYVSIRDRRPPSKWSQEERWIGQGVSPLSKSGDIRYDINRMPWCKDPTDSAIDPAVEVTALQWASAMGKTDGVESNVIGWGIAERPLNIQACFPYAKTLKKWVRDVFDTGLMASPVIADKVAVKKSRDSGNTDEYKKYPGGSLYATIADSVASFRGPRIDIAIAIEIDAYPATVGVEGDPITLLHRRCEGMLGIKFVEGTPTLSSYVGEDGKRIYRSRIDEWMHRSDYRKWFCPCRSCDQLQVLMWNQIRWPKHKTQSAEYFCVRCDTGHNDKQRIRMVMDGAWFPTAGLTDTQCRDIKKNYHNAFFDRVRGYWINGINSVLPCAKGFRNKMHEMAEVALDAETSPAKKRVWKNTFLCETDDPEGETEPPPDWKSVYNRREEY